MYMLNSMWAHDIRPHNLYDKAIGQLWWHSRVAIQKNRFSPVKIFSKIKTLHLIYVDNMNRTKTYLNNNNYQTKSWVCSDKSKYLLCENDCQFTGSSAVGHFPLHRSNYGTWISLRVRAYLSDKKNYGNYSRIWWFHENKLSLGVI